jgi:hypothetical protein
MTINRDAVMFVGYAVATAALTVCETHGWVSGSDDLAIQGVLTAFAAAFHIPNARAAAAIKAQAAATVTPSVTVVAEQSGPSANMAG